MSFIIKYILIFLILLCPFFSSTAEGDRRVHSGNIVADTIEVSGDATIGGSITMNGDFFAVNGSGDETIRNYSVLSGAMSGETYKGERNKLSYQNNANGTVTSSTNLALTMGLSIESPNTVAFTRFKGLSVLYTNAAYDGTVTSTDTYLVWAGGEGGSSSQTHNLTNTYLFFGQDFPDLTGTQDYLTGLWLEQMTMGDTANYGIVLDGDGAGSDIVFGPNQENRLYRDATTGSLTSAGSFDIIGNFLLTDNITDNTAKNAYLSVPSYANAEENVLVFKNTNSATGNTIFIGGGSGSYNPATQIDFYTGVLNTVTGSSKLSVRIAATIANPNNEDYNFAIRSENINYLLWADGAGDGAVGIGTNAPDALLHVAGDMYSTPYAASQPANGCTTEADIGRFYIDNDTGEITSFCVCGDTDGSDTFGYISLNGATCD